MSNTMKPKNKKRKVMTKSAPVAVPVSDFWVAALALLAQGERARGAGEVEAMQVADMRLRQAQAYASGGAVALVPWANTEDDLARINEAAGVGRPMGFDDLVKWIAINDGPKTTITRLEKIILDERGREWGAKTVAFLKAGRLHSIEGTKLAEELRDRIKQDNANNTAAARDERARGREEEKERIEKKSNKVALDSVNRAACGKNRARR